MSKKKEPAYYTLQATVDFNGKQFLVTNNDVFDWTNVREVQSPYHQAPELPNPLRYPEGQRLLVRRLGVTPVAAFLFYSVLFAFPDIEELVTTQNSE